MLNEKVTFQSLLEEMIDMESLSQYPKPYYQCKQFSSYDRSSTTPDDPETWFANQDYGECIRIEQHNGREEYVLMEHEGPGCLTRMWATNHKDYFLKEEDIEVEDKVGWVIRIYLDGQEKPAIEADMVELINGRSFIKPPLAHTSLRSGNLFMPIPYAKGCKITLDKKPYFYVINYRSYVEGTQVETFTMEQFHQAQDVVEHVSQRLLYAEKVTEGHRYELKRTLSANDRATVDLLQASAAIRELTVDIKTEQWEEALRSTVITITFDGEQTVWCPVGDFFGSGVGLNPFQDYYRTVTKQGSLSCRWIMPYETSATIEIRNLGEQEVQVRMTAIVCEQEWNEYSMHFHAGWRMQYPIPTDPPQDWNYVELKGKGVYVGDTLTVMNPVHRWWGEGDEKIYVDGDSFPTHFGTGTEDYYGYAWGGRSNEFFEHPFHAQVRCGPKTFGYNTLTRSRALDAIPFQKQLKVDMEIWHWIRDIEMAYAVAVYWYARPGTQCNLLPDPAGAARELPQPPAEPEQQ